MIESGYEFDPLFEKIVLYCCCTRPEFWRRIGNKLDPKRLQEPLSKYILAACGAVFKESGRPPSSTVIVTQHISRWHSEGRIKKEVVDAISDLFFEAAGEDVPPTEELVSEIVPIVRRKMQSEAVLLAHDEFAKRSDFTDTVSLLNKAAHLGEVSHVDEVIVQASGMAILDGNMSDRLPTPSPELDIGLGGGLRRTYLGVVMADPGGGKCHARGQGILMADGTIKLVEDISVGDRIAAPNGCVRTVLETNCGYGRMVDVCPIKGKNWRVNLDHILTVLVGGRIVDVSVRDFMCWSSTKQIKSKLVRSAAQFNTAQHVKLAPYLLGVLLGDGSTTDGSVMVTTADFEIVDALKRYAVMYKLRVSVRAIRGNAKSYGLAGIQGKKNPISTALEFYGLRRVNCHDKFVPQQYKSANKDIRLAVLAGLMDTDGYHNGRGGFDYISASSQLADDVVFLARSVGLAAYVKPSLKSCDAVSFGDVYYRVSISGNTHIIPCRVLRKRASKRRQRKNVLRTGFKLKLVGNEKYFGFTLDGDGRYLLDDFTVTHNSMYLSNQTAIAAQQPMNVAFASLELPREHQYARIVSCITDVMIDDLVNNRGDARKKAARILEETQDSRGAIYIADFEPYASTVRDLIEWVDRKEQDSGSKISLLAIDYADKLASPPVNFRVDSDYHAMRYVYEGARRDIAKARNMWVWTASQPKNRQFKDRKRLLDMFDVADSAHKYRACDLFVTINYEDPNDKSQAIYFVAKNRGGSDRHTIGPLPTDFARGRMCF